MECEWKALSHEWNLLNALNAKQICYGFLCLQDETIDFERFVGLVQDFCRTDSGRL